MIGVVWFGVTILMGLLFFVFSYFLSCQVSLMVWLSSDWSFSFAGLWVNGGDWGYLHRYAFELSSISMYS